MKIAFYTLGCKVNQYETGLLKEKAEVLGFELVKPEFKNLNLKADIYVINSCSVTNMSDRKTRQILSNAKLANPNAIVVVMGCMVDSIKDQQNISESKADILIGNDEKLRLFEIIDEYIKSKITNKEKLIKTLNICDITKYKNEYLLKKGFDVRESVKIEDGCDNFCSYCIIPYLRGRVRSRDEFSIIEEVKNLVSNGVKEVIIVGIEIASYGKDLKEENKDLLKLLSKINTVDGLERIRLGSILPNLLIKENIVVLSKIDKLCPHFHISMQSGDNDILKNMNRKYTKEDLIEICKNLRLCFEDPYIATDTIVGFPSETDEMFLNTVDTIEKMKLTEIHVFKYSKRKFTKAAKMENQIDGNIKNKRSDILLEISKTQKQKYLQKHIGKSKKVLFEFFDGEINVGITKQYIRVVVKGNKNLCGTIQDVDLISLEKESLIGKIVKKNT